MKHPLIRITLLYACGILIGSLVSINHWALLGVAFAVLVLGVVLQRLRTWCLMILLPLVGWTNYELNTAVLSPNDLRVLVGADPKLAAVRGELIETPTLRVFEQGPVERWRTVARVRVAEVCLAKENWKPAHGTISVATPAALTNLFGGQKVEIGGVLALPRGATAEGTFDYRSLLKQQAIYYALTADNEQDWKILQSPSRPPMADRFRNWGRAVLARGLPAEDESLRLEWALTLGWKTGLTEQSSEPFIRAATYHIFAVDGLRMAIVFGILFYLLRACRVPRWLAGLVLLPTLWFYVALTGWPASAIRACVMLTLVICGWVLKRPGNVLNSLFAAALLILLWQPQQLFQAGFQLSFVVVLFMILLMPMAHKIWSKITAPDPFLPSSLQLRWPTQIRVPAAFLGDITLTSLVAWMASLPLVALYFNIITPVSTPANVAAVPLCALVLISNLASLICAPVLPWISELFNYSGWFLMECIRLSSQWFADWPKAWFYVPAPGLFTITTYYVLLLGLCTGWLLKQYRRPLRIGSAATLLVVWCATLLPELNCTRLSVLPANGGMVTLVDAPGRSDDLLVDCGNTNAVQFSTKPFLQAQGFNKISALVLSHGDLHHVGGVRVLERILPVTRVYASPLRFRSRAYKQILASLDETKGLLARISHGDRLRGWEVLHPLADDRFSRADDGALVLRREIRGTRILLLSDLGKDGQSALLEREANLAADIVITGLPASGEPVIDALLDAVKPRLVLVADSDFPVTERASKPLRDRLRWRDCAVVFTRDTGAATLEFRNHEWKLRCMNGLQITSHEAARVTQPASSEMTETNQRTAVPGVATEDD